jgi:ribosome biogenesis protein BMS1
VPQRKRNVDEWEGDDADERRAFTGFRPGAYLRVRVAGVPCELVRYLDPRRLLLLGGLAAQEDQYGFIQVRIKKHRSGPLRFLSDSCFLDPSSRWSV